MAIEPKTRRLLFVPVALAGAAFAVLGALNPTNFAATHADHSDARLRTRRYRCSLDEAREAVEAVIPTLTTYGRHWRVVGASCCDVRAEVPDDHAEQAEQDFLHGAGLGELQRRVSTPSRRRTRFFGRTIWVIPAGAGKVGLFDWALQ